ncbi:acyloxyacyl hydrolase [Afifella pfennigii]|uniref:acyloxyacyl hydrolase n=1 Tax=Afifella pfennigii TaxID=209897 RepID=UPI00055629F4|nr:acyloxyacyl hydrolase [Afifella pfennigii]
MLKKWFFLGLAAALSPASSWAADLPAPSPEIVYSPEPVAARPFIEEIRLGPSGFVDERPRVRNAEKGVFINGELIFANPIRPFDNRVLDFVLRPRPHLGATVSTTGGTSQAYAGLTWDLYVTDRIFLEGTFGGTVHNGGTSSTAPTGPRLGCSLLFRESAGIGFAFTRNFLAMAFIDHSSNAGLCKDNDGLTHAGVKVGYRF